MWYTWSMKISYSQINSYATCPEQYRLERIIHAPSIPSWPAIGGNAVHTMTEVNDYRDNGWPVPDELAHIVTFDDALDYEIKNRLEQNPTFTKSQWHVGGRVSKENPNKEDEKWWRQNGPGMVTRWKNFLLTVPWDIYVHPTEGPAIEVAVEYETPDGDTMRGFIDRVFQDRSTGLLIVVDLKSGQAPKANRQLGFYKIALERSDRGYPPVEYGTFWMARTGVTSDVVDLFDHSGEKLDYASNSLHKAVEAGIYIPNPSSLCGVCSVRDSCYEMHPETTPKAYLPWPTVKEA